MKNNLDGVLVVEGKDDVSYLSSFINGLFFTTNGYDLNEQKIKFLKEVSKVNKIIIMTDNDDAGKVIRNRLLNAINTCFVVEISGKSRKNYLKNGVAESNRDELINLLTPYFVKQEIKPIDYHLNHYFLSYESAKNVKNKLIEKYRLINGNTKYIEKQLNMLKVSQEEISNFMKENM